MIVFQFPKTSQVIINRYGVIVDKLPVVIINGRHFFITLEDDPFCEGQYKLFYDVFLQLPERFMKAHGFNCNLNLTILKICHIGRKTIFNMVKDSINENLRKHKKKHMNEKEYDNTVSCWSTIKNALNETGDIITDYHKKLESDSFLKKVYSLRIRSKPRVRALEVISEVKVKQKERVLFNSIDEKLECKEESHWKLVAIVVAFFIVLGYFSLVRFNEHSKNNIT